MGYYTNYVVEANNIFNPAIHDFISEFLKRAYYPFYQRGDTWSIDETKWYNCHKDMLQLSKQPEVKDVLFRVSGEGEDRKDSWVAYFKNGKMVVYRPTVVWPKFTENDLE